jgi:hypothetical protein
MGYVRFWEGSGNSLIYSEKLLKISTQKLGKLGYSSYLYYSIKRYRYEHNVKKCKKPLRI